MEISSNYKPEDEKNNMEIMQIKVITHRTAANRKEITKVKRNN